MTRWETRYLRVRWQAGPVAYLHIRRDQRTRRVFTVGGRGGLWIQVTERKS